MFLIIAKLMIIKLSDSNNTFYYSYLSSLSNNQNVTILYAQKKYANVYFYKWNKFVSGKVTRVDYRLEKDIIHCFVFDL